MALLIKATRPPLIYVNTPRNKTCTHSTSGSNGLPNNRAGNLGDNANQINYEKLAESTMGIVSNSIGLISSGILIATPECTGLTKVLGGALAVRSFAGLALNVDNFWSALYGYQTEYNESSLLTYAAASIAPGNAYAKGAAQIADLSIDFFSGRAPMTITHFSDGTWMTMNYKPITDNFSKGIDYSVSTFRVMNYFKQGITAPIQAAQIDG